MHTKDVEYYIENVLCNDNKNKAIASCMRKSTTQINEVSFYYEGINQWKAVVNNMHMETLYDLFLNTSMCRLHNYISDYYDMNEIIDNNDISTLKKIIKLKGGLFTYINDLGRWGNCHLGSRNKDSLVDEIIDNEIPFTYNFQEKDEWDEGKYTIYANNVDGVYYLRNHSYIITNDDKEKVKRKKLMDSV